MKTLLVFLLVFCFATGAAHSQEKVDVVRMKNGVTYRGTLLSSPTADTIELRDSRVSVLSFMKEEVEKITAEYPSFTKDSLATFGGVFSIGWSIGGGGLFGVPLRFRLGQQTVFETGFLYRPFLKSNPSENKFKGGMMVVGSINLGMKKKYNPVKRKVVSNGVFFRGGTGISKYKESLFGFGWARERFKPYNKNASFVSELGPGLLIRHWVTNRTGLVGNYSRYDI